MRVLSVTLENFASYDYLEFDMTNQGLTLVQGPTGAGKSTLCDAIPWILFGTTAKGGAVTDVLSWPGDKVVTGRVVMEGLQIRRSRGTKAKDNDLFFMDEGSVTPIRGKDLNDTQRLINQKLGLNAELYLAGAYYHEFSQTAQFFTTTAKIRRNICEQIVDLTMPKQLQEKAKEYGKKLNTDLCAAQKDQSSLESKAIILKQTIQNTTHKRAKWEIDRTNQLAILRDKDYAFEGIKRNKIQRLETERQDKINSLSTHDDTSASLKARIKKLSNERCKECGGLLAGDEKEKLVLELNRIEKLNAHNDYALATIANYDKSIAQEKETKNTYQEQVSRLQQEENPHSDLTEDLEKELVTVNYSLDTLKTRLQNAQNDIADNDLLIDILGDFRSQLIANTITDIETKTNSFLAEYFDAEMRVTFTAQDADKLEVEITKDGNLANFTQLSKGQRGILKLCFGVAVMQGVSNHHGVDFSQLFFDESVDGLDANMKLKAVRLFESLALNHESVFLIEHASEVKASITNQYQVSLVDGKSTIEKAS